jgi:hypothetical protein
MSLVIGPHLVLLTVMIGRFHHHHLGVDNGNVRTSYGVIVITTVTHTCLLEDINSLIGTVGHPRLGVIVLIVASLLLLIETFLTLLIESVAENVSLTHFVMTTTVTTTIAVITTQVWMVIFNDYVDESEMTGNLLKTA